MNSTAENAARQKCAELFDPERVTVRVKTSRRFGFCLPDKDGDEEHTAIFATMTFGDNYAIDQATLYEVEVGEQLGSGKKITTQVSDINEFKRLIVKKNLLSWSLDIPIERDQSGWMTSDSYSRVSSVPAPLLEAFVSGFEESMEVSNEEEEKISRQCAILFSKSGHGVTDACEAISRFCTLGNFSEKFGINRDSLPKMPYKEFLLLKIVIAKESDALRAQQPKSHSGAVGQNGRSRPSRSVRIPLPGSGGA
jgi:hypothetical protein